MGNQNSSIKSELEEIKKSKEEIKKSKEEIKKNDEEKMKKETRNQMLRQRQLSEYLKTPLIKLPKMLDPTSKRYKYLKYKQKYLRLKKLLDIN